MSNTEQQFTQVIETCRALFESKMLDYGTAWRVLRPASITDQIAIKIKRIINVQTEGKQRVEESEEDGFIAIVNYSIIALIQLSIGKSDNLDDDPESILKHYDRFALEAKTLMTNKNHDYGEAWRDMRISSISDLIYQKVLRVKKIEDNEGKTMVSEGFEGNYFDMLNYAVFCLIKLDEEKNNQN